MIHKISGRNEMPISEATPTVLPTTVQRSAAISIDVLNCLQCFDVSARDGTSIV